MKKLILLQISIILLYACSEDFLDENNDYTLGDVCQYRRNILPPSGFAVDTIGEIDFNGSVQSFQFLDQKIGYALVSNNVGGYVEVFKTEDSGITWNDLEIGIDQFPRSMIFKDENIGLITVNDVTGCPNNCQNKTVILKTENGGQDWQEIELPNLNGTLYHPQFDETGNLYANLSQFDTPLVMVKSVDNGATWDTLYYTPDLNFQLLTFSYALFEDELYIPTNDGDLVVIDTDGNFIRALPIGDDSIWDVSIIDKNTIVIALSGKVIKSTNGGATWETIYNKSARIIGFENAEKGLMLQKQSACPTDFYQVNDLFASTNNGGLNWNEAEMPTTNLRINFANSQQMGESIWYTIMDNYLISIYEVQLK